MLVEPVKSENDRVLKLHGCSFDESSFYFPFEQFGFIGYASTEVSSGDRLNPYPYPYLFSCLYCTADQ